MTTTGHENSRLDEINREIDELQRSIGATRAHGIFYYLLLATIIFVGFAVGYATHNLVGAGIILVGLAIVAWREVTGFRARSTVINHMLEEKMAEKRQIEERFKEFE
jgi:hypothetical protein